MRMPMRRVIAAAVLFACSQAGATELKVLGATLALPFDYRIVEREQSSWKQYGLETGEEIRIEIADGPLRGQQLLVDANYWTPSPSDAAELQKYIDEESAEEAKKAGTHVSEMLRIDGHALQYIAQRNESPTIRWPEYVGLQGLVSGSVYSLRVHAKDVASLTPELAASLRGVVFDYESMVRARGRFDEEARAAVQDRKLVTPIGTFELPKGADIAFSGAALLTDGEGKVLRRDRQFTAGKVDFWAGAQYEGLRFSCMTDRDDVWQEVSTFYDRDTTKPVKERTIHVGGDKPTPFLGATGVVVKGKGPEFAPGDRRSLDRTLLRADGMIYMFTVSRMGNGQMGDKVARQLRTATPRCEP